jgi:hypothetical protein
MPNSLVRNLKSAFSIGVGYEPTPPGNHLGHEDVRGYYLDFSAKTTSPSAAAPLFTRSLGHRATCDRVARAAAFR